MGFVKVKTALALGVPNLARVFAYQLGIKTGLNPIKKLHAELEAGLFFDSSFSALSGLKPNNQWLQHHYYFGKAASESGLPNWHQSCLSKKSTPQNLPWYEIADFDTNIGDIKGIWEASRFDWCISFAQKAKLGDSSMLDSLNGWLNDWVENNAPYLGVNWKCGQEASIRVIHLSLTALLLEQTVGTQRALLTFIKVHLKRISPTMMYAIAQDNNHGTSEAAALYIGGSWLALNGDPDGWKWHKQGLRWLENRAKRLIEKDGSFSQYSVNYHRVMLDTYCMTEVWRKKHKLPDFSARFYDKLRSASIWLYYFTNPENGDAPNLGANDGARLIPLTGTDYRDFRPSVQLSCALFLKRAAYETTGEYDLPLEWLQLSKPMQVISAKDARDFSDGGYCYLTTTSVDVFLRYPSFKFRPSQCDSLHIDMWVKGVNLFRDGGTYSYNAGQSYIDYYGGVRSHNTVQFDDREQMPRLSRFLLGDWLKTSFKDELSTNAEAKQFSIGYVDRKGCSHKRQLHLSDDKLTIVDQMTGFNTKAVLRFRLAPLNWSLEDNELICDMCRITFSADVEIRRVELMYGKESRYYYQETTVPVIEIEIVAAGCITTEVYF
ncbi:heparinase II/III domain-containing protein [Kangiella sp.]|uniref:heparinase II/III domain-containing protein n=1 Tax=Kangiella sp. TaxID=1920245 RepID=UPI003A8DA4CA